MRLPRPFAGPRNDNTGEHRGWLSEIATGHFRGPRNDRREKGLAMTKPKGWPCPSLHCRGVYPSLRHYKEPLPPSTTLLWKARTPPTSLRGAKRRGNLWYSGPARSPLVSVEGPYISPLSLRGAKRRGNLWYLEAVHTLCHCEEGRILP